MAVIENINSQIAEQKSQNVGGMNYSYSVRNTLHKISDGNTSKSLYLTPQTLTDITPGNQGPTQISFYPGNLEIDLFKKMTLEFTINNISGAPILLNNWHSFISYITEEISGGGGTSSNSTRYYPEPLFFQEIEQAQSTYEFSTIAQNIGISTTLNANGYYPPQYASVGLPAGSSVVALLDLPMTIVQAGIFAKSVKNRFDYKITWQSGLQSFGPAVTPGDLVITNIRIHIQGTSLNSKVRGKLSSRAREMPQVFNICYWRRYYSDINSLALGNQFLQTYLYSYGKNYCLRNYFATSANNGQQYLCLDTLFGNSSSQADLYCFNQNSSLAILNTEASSKLQYLKYLMTLYNKQSPFPQMSVYDFWNGDVRLCEKFGAYGAPEFIDVNSVQLRGTETGNGVDPVPAALVWFQLSLTQGQCTIDTTGNMSIKFFESN
ncbi:MAG TPA: hypothetical protein PKI46_02615 [Bacteroidales bacterium]|nr:hypothetical protein [Bacteroidales bacterium]